MNSVNFKGSYKTTENGGTYYHTHKAAIMTLPIAALNGLVWNTPQKTKINKDNNIIYKKFKLNDEQIKVLETSKSGSKLKGLIAFGVTMCCGLLVDYLRNKKAKEKADLVARVGTKRAIGMDPEINLSNKKKPYYESDVGAKLGIGLGIICGLTNVLLGKGKITKKADGVEDIVMIMMSVIASMTFGLGGYTMGKLYDYSINKQAQKKA